MKEAAASNKIFEVYVTSSSPDNNGYVQISLIYIIRFIFFIATVSFNLHFIFIFQTEKKCAKV